MDTCPKLIGSFSFIRQRATHHNGTQVAVGDVTNTTRLRRGAVEEGSFIPTCYETRGKYERNSQYPGRNP